MPLGGSIAADALVPLTDVVEVLAPAMVVNPHYGTTTPDWTTPTVSATVPGALYPASTRALERAGLLGRASVFEVITSPAALVPQGRARVGARVFLVLDVRVFPEFTHAIVEEVTA
jgi:hypothetical protein